ncbi:MAG: hypothetical protein GDA40_08290 [Rhodobacteraceae bacterium]|nr:hypothetical protein [Paracoccaceae bacterium]
MTFTSDDYTVQGITLEADGTTTPPFTATSLAAANYYNPTQIADEDRSAVLYRHTASGLDLLESRQRDSARRAFGSWMENASFAVITGVEPDLEFYGSSGIEGSASYAYAAGDQTGSNPASSLASYIGRATWEGVMVATTRTGNVAGNILQGDASLTYTGADNTLDIDFTNIKDIDRGGAAHGDGSDIEFNSVPVSETGTYAVAETGDNGRSLNGAFYGPSHAEAAGVFEHSGLVGSFGALQAEIETLFTEVTPTLLTALGGETTTTTVADILEDRLGGEMTFTSDDYTVQGIALEEDGTTTALTSSSRSAGLIYNPTQIADEDRSTVLYRHTASGLDLLESRQRDAARRAFGSWMKNASFAVITGVEPDPEFDSEAEIDGSVSYAYAAGDQTGSNLASYIGRATWEGVMLATTRTGNVAGNILQGDASLTFGQDEGSADYLLDIAFTNIRDIDRGGAAHSDPNFGFEDLRLQPNGTYRHTVNDSDGEILERLAVALYGPGHEEAAGFFEYYGLVGSFGALQAEIETLFTDVTPALLAALGAEETDTTVADILASRIGVTDRLAFRIGPAPPSVVTDSAAELPPGSIAIPTDGVDEATGSIATDGVYGALGSIATDGDNIGNVFINGRGDTVYFDQVYWSAYTADGATLASTCTGSSSRPAEGIDCDFAGVAGDGTTIELSTTFNPAFIADRDRSGVLYRKAISRNSNSEIVGYLNMIESRQRDSARRAFGSWMEYANFGVVTDSALDGGPPGPLTHAVAAGDRAFGSFPGSGSATWNGVMVATTTTGEVAGNILQGDASLEYTGADNTLDVMFDRIKDIDHEGADHSVTSVAFQDVPVEEATYEVAEVDGNGRSLSGAFYGPNHEEAAGIFEHSGLVGSFGARQTGAAILTEATQALLDNIGAERTETTVDDIQGARIDSDGNFIDTDGNAVVFDHVNGLARTLGDDTTYATGPCSGEASSASTDILCDGGGVIILFGFLPLTINTFVNPADLIAYTPTDIVDGGQSGVFYRHSASGLDIIESQRVVDGIRTLGAWMDHAHFEISAHKRGFPSSPASLRRLAIASGDATGSRPADDVVSATWNGVMFATPKTGDFADNILQGDASLEYTGADNTLDIDFTKIVDIDREGAAHSVPSVGFEDVGLETNGTYAVDEMDDNGIRLDGALYGPNYENTAGVFEHSGMVGSFGAVLAAPSDR